MAQKAGGQKNMTVYSPQPALTFFSIIKDSDHIYYVPALLTMVLIQDIFLSTMT